MGSGLITVNAMTKVLGGHLFGKCDKIEDQINRTEIWFTLMIAPLSWQKNYQQYLAGISTSSGENLLFNTPAYNKNAAAPNRRVVFQPGVTNKQALSPKSSNVLLNKQN